MTERARIAVMLGGEISKHVDTLEGVAQEYIWVITKPTQYIYINDLIVAIEATEQGVTVGGDTVSGLTFADDFVGISETPEK